MGFLKYISKVVTGRMAKENQLVGNHCIRIMEKVKNTSDNFLKAIVNSTAICSYHTLIDLLFDEKKYQYADGFKEFNPFFTNIDKISREISYDMFKLIAGYFFGLFLLTSFYSLRYEDVKGTEEDQLKNNFLTTYEFDAEDKKFFDDLLEVMSKMLSEDKGSVTSEILLYERIFKQSFGKEPPELIVHQIKFTALCQNIYSSIFPDEFIKMLHKYREH